MLSLETQMLSLETQMLSLETQMLSLETQMLSLDKLIPRQSVHTLKAMKNTFWTENFNFTAGSIRI